MKENTKTTQKIISKEAIHKIGNYAGLSALGIYMKLTPQKAQVQSTETPVRV